MESIGSLAVRARSYRRFDESRPVALEVLEEMVDAARVAPSSANLQPLRYILATSPDAVSRIFPHIGWAAQLKDWQGPAEGERPTAYIIVIGDKTGEKHHQIDAGIAAQTMQLGLASKGIGCCMLGNINRNAIAEIAGIPDDFAIVLLLAVGYPGERITIEEIDPGQPTAYWRDAEGGHHVPKRRLAEALFKKI